MQLSDSSSNVLDGATIDSFVPSSTDLPFDEALAESVQEIAADAGSLAPGISQRRLLLFDETLPVHIVLRLNNCDEDALKALLKRLKINLTAHVVEETADNDKDDVVDDGRSKAHGVRDVVFNGDVDEHDDPSVVVNSLDAEEADGEGNGPSHHLYVIWKMDVFLRRPRIRVQFPKLSMSASATLNTASPRTSGVDDMYLSTGVPASANILQSVSEAPANSVPDLYLPVSRLLKVVPVQELERSAYSVQQPYNRIFRVTPVTNARIRYSRGNYFAPRPFLLASLDFEVAPSSPYEIVFESARLQLLDGGGGVECLSDGLDFKPPITCRPRDDATLIYKLTPRDLETARNGALPLPPLPSVSVLEISLAATAIVPDLGYRPSVTMQWRTNVEFPSVTDPAVGGPSAMLHGDKRVQRASFPPRPDTASHRPSTGRSIGSTMTAAGRPTTTATVTATATDPTASNNGVTILFSGPEQVIVGQEFCWDVFIVNRSNQARRFALGSVLRRKHADARKNIARPSSSSGGRKNERIAETVTDSNVLYVMQKNAISSNTDLVSLSTDVRAGPLAPGACHQTKMRFLPLATGPLQIEAVRVVDLVSNETFDIRHLPHIMARSGSGSGGGSG